jgi:hypothetical protein
MAKGRFMMLQEWIQMSSRRQGLERAVHSLVGSDSTRSGRPSGLSSVAEKGLPEESRGKMEILMTCLKSSNSSSPWEESLAQRHVDQALQLEGKQGFNRQQS